MSKYLIDEFLDELHDLIQECKELLEEHDIKSVRVDIKENMNQIKSVADKVLDLV